MGGITREAIHDTLVPVVRPRTSEWNKKFFISPTTMTRHVANEHMDDVTSSVVRMWMGSTVPSTDARTVSRWSHVVFIALCTRDDDNPHASHHSVFFISQCHGTISWTTMDMHVNTPSALSLEIANKNASKPPETSSQKGVYRHNFCDISPLFNQSSHFRDHQFDRASWMASISSLGKYSIHAL